MTSPVRMSVAEYGTDRVLPSFAHPPPPRASCGQRWSQQGAPGAELWLETDASSMVVEAHVSFAGNGPFWELVSRSWFG